MKNKYEIRDDITVIFISSKKYGEIEVTISTESLKRVNAFPNAWCVSLKGGYLYCSGGIYENGIKYGYGIHQWITEPEKGMYVDHINHDTLDNTISNLRILTNAENQQNRSGAQINSSSGVRGVYWHKTAKKWCGKIKLGGVNKHVGSFSTIAEAEQAVINARKTFMPYTSENIA